MAKQYLALDVGERRIGVASASSDVKIAVPGDWIDVDGKELDIIREMLIDVSAQSTRRADRTDSVCRKLR